MNILVLSDAFWPDHTGGISKSLLPEVEGLAARGHHIVVVTRSLNPDSPSCELRGGYRLYRYTSPSKGTIYYRLYPFFTLHQLPKLVSDLHSQFHFDVGYVHNVFQAVALSRSSARIPYVYVFHAPTPLEIAVDATKGKYGYGTWLVKVVNRWIAAMERKALSEAQAIIVRSQYMMSEMWQLYGDLPPRKTFRIPLGVDGARFAFNPNPNNVRKELGLSVDRPILLTVRRLVARMGLENLISAMAEVVNKVPNALLLIAGKGYLENSFRKQVQQLRLESYIRFLGFVSENRLSKYYQAADLFVLPTAALEGFGLSTIEALSCGTPVVATPVGGNPEVVGPLGREFLTKDATARALADSITWFIDHNTNPELRRVCRDYCQRSFGIQKVVEALEQTLGQVTYSQ